MNKPKAILSWSSGKDSAWTLHTLRLQDEFEVAGLLTTFNRSVDRVAMHATRRTLTQAQAEATGLPLFPVWIPSPCPNDIYEAAISEALSDLRARLGITTVAFGDLFLEDIREYREKQLARIEIEPVFPIWGLDTTALAQDMVDSGLKAILTCVDPKALPADFAGRTFDEQLLRELPEGVDPCGEHGEFHTFAFDGPMFNSPISCSAGEIVERDGFVFADVT